MTQSSHTFSKEIRAALPLDLPTRLGVAVSGGGDSVALLNLLSEALKAENTELLAVTVDHGLRKGSAAEAAGVAALAKTMGLAHDTLHWTGWNGTGNLQDQARRARYRLLVDWAKRNEVTAIALGHTADDQAETVLMRLGRASGVSGLAAMSRVREQGGVLFLRPMLGITRNRLRQYLCSKDLAWVEDPSNRDVQFDRIKVRKSLPEFETLGITPLVLAEVAQNMAQARDALDHYLRKEAEKLTTISDRDILVDRQGFAALPDEIARRLIVAIVRWIGGGDYPPRRASVRQIMTAMAEEKTAVLGGCLLLPDGGNMRFCREYNAVRDCVCSIDAIWDRRWHITGPLEVGIEVRALGAEGLKQVPDWRAVGRPYSTLLATPSVWRGEELRSAPLAGFANGWEAKLLANGEEFYASLLSH